MRVDANSGAGSSGSTTAGTGQQSDMFMKLLMAQLQAQDPMSPMDANSFVDQMVQFNTLDEITQIRDMMQTLMTAPSTDAAQK